MRSCLIPSKELPTKPAQYILHGLLQWGRNVLSFSVQTSRYIYSSSSCCRAYARMDVSGIRNKPPYPLFEIHGTEDKTSMWNGDPNNEGGWGKYIAVPIAVNYWAIQNRCTHEITDTIASIDSLSNHTIISHKYVNGINRNEVWLYEIKGGKHSWGEKDLNTSEHIWLFFSKFVR